MYCVMDASDHGADTGQGNAFLWYLHVSTDAVFFFISQDDR